MKKAICRLSSVSPYSQNKYVQEPMLDKELHKDYETRTWRHRMHVNKETDKVFIPAMAFANCLKEAARYLSIKVPGKNRQTYTKHFESGIMVLDNVSIEINSNDVLCETLFVPSNGQRGGDKRVLKTFPLIEDWTADVTFLILDDTITQDIFDTVLGQAGQLIGLGRFRPRNWGYYGRFVVDDLQWVDCN